MSQNHVLQYYGDWRLLNKISSIEIKSKIVKIESCLENDIPPYTYLISWHIFFLEEPLLLCLFNLAIAFVSYLTLERQCRCCVSFGWWSTKLCTYWRIDDFHPIFCVQLYQCYIHIIELSSNILIVFWLYVV